MTWLEKEGLSPFHTTPCDICHATVEGVLYKCLDCVSLHLCRECVEDARGTLFHDPALHSLRPLYSPLLQKVLPLHTERCAGCSRECYEGKQYRCSSCVVVPVFACALCHFEERLFCARVHTKWTEKEPVVGTEPANYKARAVQLQYQLGRQLAQVEVEVLETEATRLAGSPLQMESSASVAEVLFTRLRLPYPGGGSTNKKHLPTNKSVLEKLLELHPLPRVILSYRRLAHAISASLVPLSQSVRSSTGRIHCRLQLATQTGRLLSHSPNVQNVGKEELLAGFSVRRLFRAGEGRCLVAADYSQLELRVLAHLSSDPTLIRLLNQTDSDMFSDLAIEWKQTRTVVKQLCYGIIYGMGAQSLSETIGSTREEAQRLIQGFFRSFPKVRTYIYETQDKGARLGYVETAMGRKRLGVSRGRQEDRARDDRQNTNYTIQGTASEIFKTAIVRLHPRLKAIDGRVVLPMHDEVVVEVAEKNKEEAIRLIRWSLEGAFDGSRVDMRVKVASGPDWAALK